MAAVVSVRPPRAKAGDEVQVRLIVGHPQENGLRRDPGTGERIARNVNARKGFAAIPVPSEARKTTSPA